MARLRFLRRARDDLLEIWLHIARDNGRAADRVIDRIETKCGLLGDNPELGPPRPEIGDGVRALHIDKWIAFYRLTDGDGIEIVRVVDSRRDLRRLKWRADP